MHPRYDKTLHPESIKCQTFPYSLATQLMLYSNQFSEFFFVFGDKGYSSIATKNSNQFSFTRPVQQCHDVRLSGKSVSEDYP